MGKFDKVNIQPTPTPKVYGTLIPSTEIQDIPLNLIDEFENHPFQVNDDDDMEELVNSIKDKGQLTPAIVRPKNGRYEMVSGHRRMRALLKSGYKTIQAEVKNLTDDEAIIIMTDCNLQRSTIKPSEKAKALKMKLEAIKRTAGRPKNNYSQVGNNFDDNKKTIDIIVDNVGESKNQIYRYIRILHLNGDFMEMVDNEELPFSVGVELSYLSLEEQGIVYNYMLSINKMPKIKQAKYLREISKKRAVTKTDLETIFEKGIKADTKRRTTAKKYSIKRKDLEEYIPIDTPEEEFIDIIKKALELYKIMEN